MARGVKGLGSGVIDGITGIVKKPIEGAKQEGGYGFMKGVGKVQCPFTSSLPAREY